MLKSQRRGLKINVDNDNDKNISDSVTCVILWFIKCTFYSLSFVWRHHQPPSPQPNFLKLWIELFNSFHVPVSSRLPRRTSHQSSYWNSPPTETVWCRTDSNLTAAVVVVGLDHHTICSQRQLFQKTGSNHNYLAHCLVLRSSSFL